MSGGGTGTDSGPPAQPCAVIALLLYNHADTLPETLDSLRLQSRPDFAVLLVDDGSSDATPDLCRAAAEADPRFVYLNDGTRRGYIGNARHALAEARRRFPEAPYFAWGSDHDLYHPRWLACLTAALDARPEAGLAWPLSPRIDAEGRLLERVLHRFASEQATPLARFRRTLKASLTGETVVGNMIYGLFRREVFEGGPGLPRLLLPDRVAVLEAALAGPVLQVPEPLWYRRYEGIASHARQKRASFFGGAPWYLALPVWITHVGHFLGRHGVAPAWAYATGFARWHTWHRLRMRGPQWRRQLDYALVKPLRLALHRADKRLRGLGHGVLRRLRLT
jgi:glycosyltransferase involved in cell wall biosynthesis